MAFTIESALLQKIYDYLDTRPRREVNTLCLEIEQLALRQTTPPATPPQDPEADTKEDVS